MPKNLGVDTFPDPVGHFGFCRRCGVAGAERVPPSPLGWYFIPISILGWRSILLLTPEKYLKILTASYQCQMFYQYWYLVLNNADANTWVLKHAKTNTFTNTERLYSYRYQKIPILKPEIFWFMLNTGPQILLFSTLQILTQCFWQLTLCENIWRSYQC